MKITGYCGTHSQQHHVYFQEKLRAIKRILGELLNVRARDHSAQPPAFTEKETEAPRARAAGPGLTAGAPISGERLGPYHHWAPGANNPDESNNAKYFCKRVCLFVLVGSRETVLPPSLSEQLPASA